MSDRGTEPEWALVTILIADVRGFTTFADRATAREAADYLGEVFGAIVPVVGEHGGRVHRLLGDGLLALFEGPGHADAALRAGCAMLDAVDERLGDRCRIGVGLNSGLVLTGIIGADGFAEPAVVGDPVNVAARVQEATKALGEPLLLAEPTVALLDREHPEVRPRGPLSLRGKARPTTLYAVAGRFRNALRTPGA